MAPDDTLNGHIYSSLGLYDYYELTGSPTALALFRGALTTVAHYFPSFRNPGWISCYCLLHRICNAKYHQVHVALMLQLYALTQDVAFARFADLLAGDYPQPQVTGSVTVMPGTYTAFRFTGSTITARRSLTVSTPAAIPVTLRQRIHHRGIFFRLAGSGLRGFWLREVPGQVYLPGTRRTPPLQPAACRAARGRRHLCCRASRRGRHRSRPAGGAGRQRPSADASAVVNARLSVRLSGGILDGYWLTLGNGVALQ